MDQFFSESQFESYRRLGEHEMEKIIGKLPRGTHLTIEQLFENAEAYVT
jgi:hypothetical protein